MVEKQDSINYKKVLNEGLFKLFVLYPVISHTYTHSESHLCNSIPVTIQMEHMVTSFQNTDQGRL